MYLFIIYSTTECIDRKVNLKKLSNGNSLDFLVGQKKHGIVMDPWNLYLLCLIE